MTTVITTGKGSPLASYVEYRHACGPSKVLPWLEGAPASRMGVKRELRVRLILLEEAAPPHAGPVYRLAASSRTLSPVLACNIEIVSA